MMASNAKTYTHISISPVLPQLGITHIGTAASEDQGNHQDHIRPAGDGRMGGGSNQTRSILFQLGIINLVLGLRRDMVCISVRVQSRDS